MSQTLALTIGDPTGIGPEIVVKLLQDDTFCRPSRLAVLGDIDHLQATARHLNTSLPEGDWVEYIATGGNHPGDVAYRAIATAVELVATGQADALVTGPISKANLMAAGHRYTGHTELLEHLANQYWDRLAPWQADMLFTYGAFRVLLLSRHIPLSQVGQHLTVEGIIESLGSAIQFLQKQARIEAPHIAVMGVNPHAGEVGGDEEERLLMPAIEELSRLHSVSIDPPAPADALFRGFSPKQPAYDLYVAAYHDQGLIPMKLVAGMKAVNITIGLPFLRTSVSHGMASDIAGKGIADETSLREAIATARRLLLARYTRLSLG